MSSFKVGDTMETCASVRGKHGHETALDRGRITRADESGYSIQWNESGRADYSVGEFNAAISKRVIGPA